MNVVITDGFNQNNRYRCYSSADLATWKHEGEILKDPTDRVYCQPCVIHNKKTGKCVLWYNWYATLWDGQYGVATSDQPQGPFVIQNDNVKVAQGKPGDHGLMVDDDGTAYLIYTSIANGHSISIEKLAPDYLFVEPATYGDLASQNPARIRDVKAKVEQALRKGDGRFPVSAMAEGDDPCYETVKTLKVKYRLNGQPASFTGTEPETVDLLEHV